ncbi:MAG: (d)CMP kinase [Candidatus Eremiobacteraeota bacterium]|nr:(d)CMP kinase [Candidatus Eremiobacteraeota bacterium]
MRKNAVVIAIDGPAAAGKTTAARMLARALPALYLDTGAMYRALAYLALRTQTDIDNENALVRLCSRYRIRVQLDQDADLGFRIFAGPQELGAELNSKEVTAVVSSIAAHPRVRDAMMQEQRSIAAQGAVVMAGRDIGTVVLPDAGCKIYLTASLDARVKRRREELRGAGVDVNTHILEQEIVERDRLDENRATAPLQVAKDAHILDSSDMSAEEVVDAILRLVHVS